MKVSVVVPVYNGAEKIIGVLDSVLNQSYKVFEIILINDCSQDNTLDLINKYATLNHNFVFKIFDLKKNSGVSFCRNLGWDNANGDYVAFLDSDDYWNVNKIELMSNIVAVGNADLIGHNYNEKIILLNQYFTFNLSNLYKVNFYKLLLRNKFQTSCVILKKSLKERFDQTISHSEDYELFLRLTAKRYKIYFYDEKLTYLGRPQLSKGGLSEKKIKMRLGEVKAFQSGLMIRKISFLLPVMILYSFCKSIIKINR